MQHASGAAVTTLLKIMLDATTPAFTRLRAIEIEDVEVSVAALEVASNLANQ